VAFIVAPKWPPLSECQVRHCQLMSDAAMSHESLRTFTASFTFTFPAVMIACRCAQHSTDIERRDAMRCGREKTSPEVDNDGVISTLVQSTDK